MGTFKKLSKFNENQYFIEHKTKITHLQIQKVPIKKTTHFKQKKTSKNAESTIATFTTYI